MAQIKEVMERESRRGTMEQCRRIEIFQEGSFYRAYEWSAWLCVRYIQQFKVTKRQFKSEGVTSVFVGFPVASLQKFTPENASVRFNEDGSVQFVLPETTFPVESTSESLSEEFHNWKQSVPLAESSKKDLDAGVAGASLAHPARLTDVMHKILAYPIEQKSPLECMSFLAEVKKGIAEII